MRHVDKGAAPPELVDHLKTPGVTYTKGTEKNVKDAIRRDAYRDQQGLCAYCCGPLANNTSLQQIDHLLPQGLYPELSLEWQNMFVSCASGRPAFEPTGRREYTCDDHKGEDILPIHPLQPDCERHFLFVRETGAVIGRRGDAEASRTIQILNLDCTRLRRSRWEAMEEAESFLSIMNREEWEKKFLNPLQGTLTPFEPAVRSLVTYNLAE